MTPRENALGLVKDRHKKDNYPGIGRWLVAQIARRYRRWSEHPASVKHDILFGVSPSRRRHRLHRDIHRLLNGLNPKRRPWI